MTDTSADLAVDENKVSTGDATPKAAVEQVETQSDDPVLSDVDLFIEKLKGLVETAGSQTHAYFDDLVELAKKLI